MLESMLLTANGGFNGPWNGVYPVEDANTLFRMHTFLTAADVRDKGPNAINVTNSNVTVGSDAVGTYMKFNGTNSVLSFTSSLLSGNNSDITFILGDVVYPTTSQYGITILDGRPDIQNGRYLSISGSQNKPFRSAISFSGQGIFGTEPVPDSQFPMVLTVKVRPGSFRAYANGKLIQEWLIADNTLAATPPWRVGRNAFVSQAATPWMNAKVYYIDFKKV